MKFTLFDNNEVSLLTVNNKDTRSSVTLTQKTNRKKVCVMQYSFKWDILKSMEYFCLKLMRCPIT